MKQSDPMRRQYRKLGPVYVKKTLLLTVLAAGSLAVIAGFGLPTDLIPENGEQLPGYQLDDPTLETLTGWVQLRDETGAVRYEGTVEKGQRSGFGRIFDEKKRLSYDGPMIEDQCEGGEARIYKDGRLAYFGTVTDMIPNGPGRAYDYDAGVIREGSFDAGVLEGPAKIYAPDGTMLRESQFVKGEEQGRAPEKELHEEASGQTLPQEQVSFLDTVKNKIFDVLWELVG